MKRKQYEYDIVMMPAGAGSSINAALGLVEELNKRGKLGWHAIAELPGCIVLIEREETDG